MMNGPALKELLRGHSLTIDVAFDNRPVSSKYQRILDDVRARFETVRQISSLRISRAGKPVKRPSFRVQSSRHQHESTYEGPADPTAIMSFLVDFLQLQETGNSDELSC
ncbi:hypothetical protein NBRC3257_3270 [Gluconobacter thailandicus NBRC 3257]|uniref:Uncharacterized protein n=1 Tax=Gluconobacter thailandicus NBRC 3257 TaxID=1381097 RepID=A0ABQ0J1C4_GLUTH|nr:hypothetical protein AD946_00695 [Gluconobacter thailandicus]GAC89452.1 hypothetical protein NBRC3255_3113 [Gluconobacter thailandicus NBRC 3255]GAD28271.1 hypothetical protein NBRC3257_3270 [Gluconobacter thailandicus NBRC 3257]